MKYKATVLTGGSYYLWRSLNVHLCSCCTRSFGKDFHQDVKLLNPRKGWINTGKRSMQLYIYMLHTTFLLGFEGPKNLDNPFSRLLQLMMQVAFAMRLLPGCSWQMPFILGTATQALGAPEISLGRIMSSHLPLVSLPGKWRVIRNRLCLTVFYRQKMCDT